MSDSQEVRAAGHEPVKPTSRVRKRVGNIAIVLLVIGIFGAAAYIFAAPVLDQADKQWVTCEVHSAKSAISGGRAAEYGVRLSTSCGQVWFHHGVNRDNAAKIAREFTPHSAYEFQFGWLSRMYVQFGISSPNAQAWRKAQL